MPDSRPQHFHYPPSLMNQKTPPFNGAAHAIYGDRGPRAASPDYGPRGRKPLSTAPETIEHHVDDVLARVKDLSPRQKTALKAEFGRMLRDIHFLRQITEQARATGPWSEAATHLDSQGNPITG
jgi:hypothetical protein